MISQFSNFKVDPVLEVLNTIFECTQYFSLCITVSPSLLAVCPPCLTVYACVYRELIVLMAWRVMSCIANQSYKICPSRLAYTKETYFATISACSGSDQTTAVGCKRVRGRHRSFFSTTALSTGGLTMIKLEVAAQPTLPIWCCLLSNERDV